MIALGVVVVVAVIAAGVAWRKHANARPIRTIAVLPLVNQTGNPGLDYISDGRQTSLTNALAHLQDVHVAARTSAYQFRGKNEDVRAIGRKLNVTGSVRLERNRLRVAAQLVDTRSGYQVWSDTFDGAMDDLLNIQRRMAGAAARALNRDFTLTVSSQAREGFVPYLEGRYFLRKGGRKRSARLQICSGLPLHAILSTHWRKAGSPTRITDGRSGRTSRRERRLRLPGLRRNKHWHWTTRSPKHMLRWQLSPFSTTGTLQPPNASSGSPLN